MSKYDELGLKVGFEFHQQLDTEHKLFCNCPTKLSEKDTPDYTLTRYLHPTKSELGEVDQAALEEARLSKQYRYHGYQENTCLIECDEEPPQPMNIEALETCMEVSLLLNARIVDQVHTMRKIVIDGSNTTGFQRTSMIATQGKIETDEGEIGIDGISLEEESCRKIEGDIGDIEIVYSLDRLGIPLIEIGSEPDIKTPSQGRKFAEKIGEILRSTQKVKRGIGTIRQDINISIEEGSRIELKGAQELELIETYIEKEVERQTKLIEIKKQLQERGVKEKQLNGEIKDVTHLFTDTDSGIIKSALQNGVVLAQKLKGFKGLVGKEIQEDRRLGTELSDRAKKAGGVGGIFHTDELPKYGITPEEVEKLKKELNAEPDDCIVIIADKPNKAKEAHKAVTERARQATKGVPEETRKPLPNGGSEYMRPLPGSARMYPETDIPPVNIKTKKIKEIKQNLPELISEKIERLKKEYNINREMARNIIKNQKTSLFEETAQKNIPDTIIVRTLTGTLQELESEGYNTNKITKKHFKQTFQLLENQEISKEVIPDILKTITKNPELTAEQAVQKTGKTTIDTEQARKTIQEIANQKEEFIQERGMGALGPLMGIVMQKLDKRIDGETASEILKEEIQQKL
ncbi:Archaeal Glu-tRNAGln amidotransferase subunit E, GatE [Methanonatronarchaeum thermophilum]|uniref:Glutamyl-tRNA(Gln) amidotransferase subunit E n=1 Tax=Methanonatronarchaeum thermophilum TaxID=1927129 RepID=A0A1Y3GIC2_9EURY|nr:Glu-tRNA(Gln) amidotransferase subunit GatE [Methanonatronarchaeum thermophilum]OUJ19185.1 Archaeal Glu-tRNAGln amidotransferase subunit E, GatE [Methanonatronarchaeum thermophilum]